MDHSLHQYLAEVLPKDHDFIFHHISTPPTKSAAIFSAHPGSKPQRTYCESHLLNVSIRIFDEKGVASEISVFAIEIFIYTTKTLTTLFVSKADSTGYISKFRLPRPQSPIRPVLSRFISYLVKSRQRPHARLVVSLFARAQDQYLFPGSVENRNKHVLDDRGLIKWWSRVLDPVLREYLPEIECSKGDPRGTTAQGYLIIPGLDKNETRSFYPPTCKADGLVQKRWKNEHPLRQVAPTPNAPPRCLIPHFPDDPKARFLDDLDDEMAEVGYNRTTEGPSTSGTGHWKSVKDLDQFWEMMAFRQECSSGRMVGFIWVVFTPPTLKEPKSQESPALTPIRRPLPKPSCSALHEESGSCSEVGDPQITPENRLPSPPKSSENLNHKPPLQLHTASQGPEAKKRRRGRLTGPIRSRPPRIKGAAPRLSMSSQAEGSEYYYWPNAGRGEIVLSEKQYNRVHDLLLRLDFSNEQAATSSSLKWTDEVSVIAGMQKWGTAVTGTAEMAAPATNTRVVNILSSSSTRRKRKADEPNGAAVAHTADGAKAHNGVAGTVNNLAISAASQKPKETEAGPGINVLSSGLLRKKPKG